MGSVFQKFFDLMVGERQHQADRFGGGDPQVLDQQDDARNNASDFVTYISKYSATWLPGTPPPCYMMSFVQRNEDTLRAFQTSMVKTATLAMSAFFWAERKLALLQPVVSPPEPVAEQVEAPFKVGDKVRRGTYDAVVRDTTSDGIMASIIWKDAIGKEHGSVCRVSELTLIERPNDQ